MERQRTKQKHKRNNRQRTVSDKLDTLFEDVGFGLKFLKVGRFGGVWIRPTKAKRD